MKIKDLIFETIRYHHKDFDGYRGEINVSINHNNTNYHIKGLKYTNRKETIKELKEFILKNKKNIEEELED
jgi:hypothetical protein